MSIRIENVRLAFPKLFEAKPVGSGDTKYFSVALPIEPGSKNAKTLDEAINAVAEEKWKDKWKTVLKKIVDDGNCGYKKKPLSNSDGEVYSGFEDMYSLNASRREDKGQPTIIDRDRSQLTAKSGKPYAGCYCNVIVDIWAQDNQYGRKINFELKGVQFVKDGDAFGGGSVASADDFEDLGVEEEAGDLV
jgi:hypothetical protein